MSQIIWLEDNDFQFPDANTALNEPDGLLTASEQLSPQLVIEAYQRGIFPWYSEGQPVLWWSPNPRCVFYPEKFHVSRSFKRTLNSKQFEVRTNTVFKEVMLACAAPRNDKAGFEKTKTENARAEETNTEDSSLGDKSHEDTNINNNSLNDEELGTWITTRMVDVYCQLHEVGIAHSIECWHENKLVGGMYGLAFGDMFFGESMFSKMKDASKVAMHHVCTVIKPSLLDAQVHSQHLETLGAEVIERQEFLDHINRHLDSSLRVPI